MMIPLVGNDYTKWSTKKASRQDSECLAWALEYKLLTMCVVNYRMLATSVIQEFEDENGCSGYSVWPKIKNPYDCK